MELADIDDADADERSSEKESIDLRPNWGV